MPDRIDRLAEQVEREVLSAIDRQADALSGTLAKALSRAGRRASAAVMDGHGSVSAIAGLSGDLNAAMVSRLVFMADLGAGQVRRLADELDTKDAEMFAGYRAQWARDHAAKKVKGVTDSVRELIRRKVERAARQNQSPRQLAKEIADSLGGKAARKRAMRIARTELHQAANYGQFQEADRMRRESGRRFVKVWRSTRDARTRASHRMADGQTKPIDQPFVVGGENLMHPGDPNGSAKNVINCRCTQTIVPEQAAEVSGRPTVRRTHRGVRAELGQAHIDTERTGRALEIIRGGAHGPKTSGKLIEALAKEAIAERRALVASRTMTTAERAAFERLGRRKAIRLAKDADLPDGMITAHPRPPMLLQLATEVDDTLFYNDLINMLYSGLEVAQ